MSRRLGIKHYGLISLAVLVVVSATPSAGETLITDHDLSNCQALNCSSIFIGGTVNGIQTPARQKISNSFKIDISAGLGECLRLDIDSVLVPADLVMLVTLSDDPKVFINDNRAPPLDSRPLVKIETSPFEPAKVYTVHVFVKGAGEVNFILAFGRYVRGNPNCAEPTQPSISVPLEAAEPSDVGLDVSGVPGSR